MNERQNPMDVQMFETALDASASTVTATSAAYNIGKRIGAQTLFFEPVENSGTATDVTVTADIRGSNNSGWCIDNAVGTITAAQIAAGTSVFFALSGLSWWTWANEIRFKVAGASGTYNITLNGSLEGF